MSGAAPSACGPRSRARAPVSVRSSAASCSRTTRGARCSSSTSPSASPRSSRAASCSRHRATRNAPRLDPVGPCSRSRVWSRSSGRSSKRRCRAGPAHRWRPRSSPASSCSSSFVLWELHSSHPMLDVRFFENRRFTAANAAITLTFFALFGAGLPVHAVPAERARLLAVASGLPPAPASAAAVGGRADLAAARRSASARSWSSAPAC